MSESGIVVMGKNGNLIVNATSGMYEATQQGLKIRDGDIKEFDLHEGDIVTYGDGGLYQMIYIQSSHKPMVVQ